MTKRASKTFCAIYEEVKSSPSPLQQFISEVAQVTGKAEITVRRWAAGLVEPDNLTKRVLAKHFGTTVEKLFPPKK